MAVSQQRPHVPKFGNFESENDVPYTAYFENARSDRGTGVRMNPNDPEENPDAFNFAKKGNKNGNLSSSPVSRNGKPDPKISLRLNSTVVVSESDSDYSNSDNFRETRANSNNKSRKNSMVESDYKVPPSLGANRQRSTRNEMDMSYASASVPKFGAWDEKDPTSGNGFTVIFNKVKEEKHIAASKFPAAPPQVVTHTKARKEKETKKSKSNFFAKMRCCMFPRERDH